MATFSWFFSGLGSAASNSRPENNVKHKKRVAVRTARVNRLIGNVLLRFFFAFIEEFISIWTTCLGSNTKRQALPSAGNRSVSYRPPPHPLQGGLFERPGPEPFLHVRVPALSMTRPLVAAYVYSFSPYHKNCRHVIWESERSMFPETVTPAAECPAPNRITSPPGYWRASTASKDSA